MIASMEQRSGYNKCYRDDGSFFYLCDYCEKKAFVTVSEGKMHDHIRWVHEK